MELLKSGLSVRLLSLTASFVQDESYFNEMRKVISTVRNVASEDKLPLSKLNTPFITILAPSGTGKTQLAFSMNQHGCPCVHLLSFDPVSADIQDIYSACFRLSHNFHEQINADIVLLGKLYRELIDDSSLSQGDKNIMKIDVTSLVSTCKMVIPFEHVRLHTVGFLNAILKKRLDYHRDCQIDKSLPAWEQYLFHSKSKLTFSAMTPVEFSREWARKLQEMPCVILDEFDLRRGNKTHLLYARNLMRAISIICITMGTNSKAANLVDPSALGSENSAFSRG